MLGDWLGQLSAWLAKVVGVMSPEAWHAALSNGIKTVPFLAVGVWLWRGYAKWRAPFRAPSPKPERFNILVADLAGDKRHIHRRLLCKALEEWSLRTGVPMQVHALRRQIEDKDFLGDEGRARVAAEAQSWLHETGYDVLIWGVWLEAAGAVPGYSLRFVARDFGFREASKLSIPAFVAYSLKKMEVLVSLPETLPQDIGKVVAGAASNFLTAAANLENDRDKGALVKALRKAISVLDVEKSILSSDARVALRDQVLVSISESIGALPNEELPEYTTWVDANLAEATQEDFAYWRVTRNVLEVEVALRSADATTALEAVLERRTERVKAVSREEVPTEWGLAQYELGHVLAMLGAHANKHGYYSSAIEALQNSQSEFDLAALPEIEEHVLIVLGRALIGYGREAPTDEALVQSIATLEEVLQKQTKRSKMVRSAVLGELASAYSFLGLREIGSQFLNKAAATYERAAAEFSAASNSTTWWDVQYGHGVVLFYIGSRMP